MFILKTFFINSVKSDTRAIELSVVRIANSTNPTMVAHFVSAACLLLLVLAGLPGNLLVFLTVCFNRKFHIMRQVLLASLALCDFLTLILVVLFRSISRWAEAWVFGMPWCYGSAFAARILYFVTVLHLWAVSYERYKAIVKEPLSYNGDVTGPKLLKVVMFLWVLPIAVSLVTFTWNTLAHNSELYTCEQEWGYKNVQQGIGGLVITLVLIIPVVAIIKLNFAIFKSARAHLKRMTAVDIQNASEPERRTMRKSLKENKAAIDGVLIVGTFFLCFLPVCIMGFYRGIIGSTSVPPSVVMAALWFANSNSTWNPVIYSIRKREFRKAVVKFFRKLRAGAVVEVIELQ